MTSLFLFPLSGTLWTVPFSLWLGSKANTGKVKPFNGTLEIKRKKTYQYFGNWRELKGKNINQHVT